MDYKKEYEAALARAKDLHDNHTYGEPPQWITCEKIFPELKESEDERIRKELIEYLKQRSKSGFNQEVKICNNGISWLEKQGEQKPVVKVEPKFKIEKDKWYVCIKDLLDNYANKAFCKGDTYLSTQDGSLIPSNSNVPFKITCPDTYFRDWTIQDAKDGDVLAFDDIIMIFKSIKTVCTANTYILYCDKIVADDWCDFGNNAQPATKEQRDLLFQKIKDAGYEWDAAKKELRKIEQQAAEKLSKEQEYTLNRIVEYLEDNNCPEDWKDLLMGIHDAPYIKQKPAEWSEEDESSLNSIIGCLSSFTGTGWTKQINWLKSLKPQKHWKPSEEQMKSLADAAQGLYACKQKDDLLDIYEYLKKL